MIAIALQEYPDSFSYLPPSDSVNVGAHPDDSQPQMMKPSTPVNFEIAGASCLPGPVKDNLMTVQGLDEQAGCFGKVLGAPVDKEGLRYYSTDRLLHPPSADPRQGYRWYAKRLDKAIRYAELPLAGQILSLLSDWETLNQNLLASTPRLRAEMEYDKQVWQLKYLMSTGRYKDAVLFGKKIRRGLAHSFDKDCSYFLIARADCDLYYAQALIYTGALDEGITILKDTIAYFEVSQELHDAESLASLEPFEIWRRNLVLGRAHNNLGYAYSVEQGRYRLALWELAAALSYFCTPDLQEERANTMDNMGQVCALLYEREQAEHLIDDGLGLRRRSGRRYRIALSLNSRARAHQRFGEPELAQRLSSEALDIFERLEAQRGIGLACITQGRSLCGLGADTSLYPRRECANYLSQAVRRLKSAVSIFEQSVQEPVRLMEAYKELGRAYQGLAALARRGILNPSLAPAFDYHSLYYLGSAVELAEGKHAVLYVDSCREMAQTYFQGLDFDCAESWLKRAEQTIPSIYKITIGSGLNEITIEDCIDAFWYQMGRIELLRGHLAFERNRVHTLKTSRETLAVATRHYALAVIYLKRYSDQAIEQIFILRQIYNRLKRCRPEDISYVKDKALPTTAETYGLELPSLYRFFEKLLGFVLA